MMTSSNGNIFRVTDPLCGEFTGLGEFPTQRPVTRSFDVFFDLRPNKRLSKQPWGWWFETLSWSLRRHCNGCSSISRYSRILQRNQVRYWLNDKFSNDNYHCDYWLKGTGSNFGCLSVTCSHSHLKTAYMDTAPTQRIFLITISATWRIITTS